MHNPMKPSTINLLTLFSTTKIDPKRAIPRDEQEKTAKIFVGGVSQDATEQLFTEFFAQFGRVIDSTLMMDKDTGRPRGFGFVTFEGEGAVEACLAQPLSILNKPIEVKRAQPRGNLREEDEQPGKFARGGGGRRDRWGRGQDGPGGHQQQQQQQAPEGSGAQGMTNGMSPAMAAQVMAQMQKMYQMMQMNQMAMQQSQNANPAMMQQYMAMQNQMRGQGGQQGMNQQAMNPQAMQQQMAQMQQMQQAQMQQQGQGGGNMMAQNQTGGGGGMRHQQQFNPQEQMAFEQQKYEQQSAQHEGSVGSNGGHGTPATSWDGMYEDSPQPGGNRGRGGAGGPSGGRQGQGTPQPPQGQAPLNAPTGPKNAGKPGANYRGGGGQRGHHRGGFHPYSRNG